MVIPRPTVHSERMRENTGTATVDVRMTNFIHS